MKKLRIIASGNIIFWPVKWTVDLPLSQSTGDELIAVVNGYRLGPLTLSVAWK